MTTAANTAASKTPATAAPVDPMQECEDLREALARVVGVIDRGQSSIYRVLQQSASIRHARAKLQQHGVGA